MQMFKANSLHQMTILVLVLFALFNNVSLSHIYADNTPSRSQQQDELDTLTESHSIVLEPWMNNKAFGDGADFDGSGTFFSGQTLQEPSLFTGYSINNSIVEGFDNIKCNDEKVIPLQQASLGALYAFVSTTHGPLTAKITVKYTDETQDSTMLSLPDWQDPLADQLERYYVIQQSLSNGNKGFMFNVPIYINPIKKPAQLFLLDGHNVTSEAALHVFSLIGYPKQQNCLAIVSIEATHEWVNVNEQIIIIRVHNIGTDVVRNTRLYVSHGPSKVETIKAGLIEAIAPGHTHMARVVVKHMSRSEIKQKKEATQVLITAQYIGQTGKPIHSLTKADVLFQSSPLLYKRTPASVQKHRPPTWLKQAKFGIFIHWGLYSVPAWAPVGKSYAEWYWWRVNHQADPAYVYHRNTFGEDFGYDQFLNQWKPTHFDPGTWLDLIDQSRAKYYVFTTKHHDGIALFNTNVTDRSTAKLLQPNRDFVGDLMRISETSYPHLKRGLYFSLPEWYHPKYNDESLGWHGPPINPYTGKRVAYTGSKIIKDFVNELQVPQFQELVQYYSPDILWCDIGGIHNSSVWQADYFNQALQQGRSVSVNDRCGDGSASDFTTVEYKAVKDIPARFWEATRGMDPYSFGFNRETKPEEYASTNDLIENLVDAVSRGGNFLLNIGPEASGKIPQPMVKRLQEIGQWLDLVDGSVFNSTPYWINSNEDNFRFTMSENGKSIYLFCFPLNNTAKSIHQQITLQTPLPVQNGTNISLMNYRHVKVDWYYDKNGHLLFEFDLLESKDNEEILVFKISI